MKTGENMNLFGLMLLFHFIILNFGMIMKEPVEKGNIHSHIRFYYNRNFLFL